MHTTKQKVRLAAVVLAVAILAACNPQPVYHHWSETPTEVQEAHEPEVIQAWIDAYWRQQWIDAYNFNKWMEAVAAAEAAKKTGGSYVQGIEVCNGADLPPCRVVHRESRFNPNAQNRSSSAWGLYQFLRSTWRSVCPEYPHGSATVAQQVECARRLWNNGRGRGHWSLTL